MSAHEIVQEFTPVNAESFTFSCALDGEGVVVSLSGMVDIPNPDEHLLPSLISLDSSLSSHGIGTISFDIRALDFINSSGIKVLLQMLMKNLGRPENGRYRIVFLHDPNRKYQKKSFRSMSFLAPDLVSFNP